MPRDGKIRARSFFLVNFLSLALLAVLAGPQALAVSGRIELVSKGFRGNPPETAGTFNGDPRMSADGRYTVFLSDARNLVPGQVTLTPLGNTFLHDRVTGAITLVSHAAGAANVTGDLNSGGGVISRDGNWIVFVSRARNLVPGVEDAPAVYQLYLHERATGRITLLSRTPGGEPGNGGSGSPALSADGRFIAFRSSATDLLPGLGSGSNVLLFDRVAGSLTLVSRSASSAGQAGNGESVQPAISADGRWVAYASTATDLVAGQSDSGLDFDVFLFDRLTGANTLVSHVRGSALTAANGVVPYPGIGLSANGQFLAYASTAPDLAAGVSDPFGNPDVFLYDRLANTSLLVDRSAASPNAPDPQGGRAAILSADGRFVAWLQGPEESTRTQALLFDRLTGASRLVSRAAASPSRPSNGIAANLVFSQDGRTLLFTSTATNLVAGQSDRPDTYDVFRFDLAAGTNVLVSHADGFFRRASGDNPYPSEIAVSADGSWVVYSSYASNIDATRRDPASTRDLFLYARATNASRAITLHPPGLASRTADDASIIPSISGDGRYTVFLSTATNLVPGQVDRPATYDVFLYDRLTRETTLVSRATASPRTAGNGPATFALISRDGSSVLFASQATDLVPGQSGPPGQLFLFDRQTGRTSLVSHASTSPARGGNQSSFAGGLSTDGAIAAFSSYASDLVAGQQDRNQGSDVFAYDRRTGTVTLVSHVPGSLTQTGNSTSFFSSVSPDGSWIGVVSYAWDLAPGVPAPASPEPEDRVANSYLFPADRGNGILLGRNVAGFQAQIQGPQPLVGAQGRYAAFASYDLVRDPSTGLPRFVNPTLFLLDRSSGTLTPIATGTGTGNRPWLAGLSDDGRYLLFASNSPDVVPGQDDANGKPDLFLFDRVSGQTRLVSHVPGFPNRASANGIYEDGSYPLGRLSADGRRIVFQSDSPDLLEEPPPVPDLQGLPNVFLYETASEDVTLLSHNLFSRDRSAELGGLSPVISANGGIVAFSSRSGDLVAGDFNNWDDVFLYVLDSQ